MANFPMVHLLYPMTWSIEDTTTIICNGSRLIIDNEGDIKVEGSVKDAALGLIKYVVEAEYSPGLISWELNKAIRIEFDNGFHIEYLKPNKPAVFDELAKEFYRIVKLRMFW
jgi:hypothetical protein